MTAMVVGLFLLSFVYTPHDPNEMQLTMRFIGPGENPRYILGTDYFGRDILSRIIYGSRSIVLVSLWPLPGLGSGLAFGSSSGMVKKAVGHNNALLMASWLFPAFCWP